MNKGLNSAWWVLRLGLGIGPALAGLDKIFRTNLLTDWAMYISPLAEPWLPMSDAAFMQVVGVIELIVGVAILTIAPRIGAWVAMAWLLAIAVNLASTGMFFDLAVRDVEIALSAYALARLSAAREDAERAAGGFQSLMPHSVA
jgi:uncharacterized membrane protein YphA (DoxX/SURF4 family)